jgi:signal transduction histidine kinase
VLHPAAGEASADVVGDPARLAAHEIRSHLGLLSGYISLLQEGALGSLPEAAAPVLREMDGRSQAISRLLDDLLEDARFQDGRLHLSLEFADLRQLVGQGAGEARAGLTAKHRLDVSLPEQPLVAQVDPGRVRTILRNLLDNAVKYSPAGGSISCRLDAAGDQAVITVADDGIGIAPADAERIFRRFGRARPAAGAAIPGVGLGLYICRTLARLHGGDIKVRAKPEGGSAFLVSLPLRRQAALEGLPSEEPRRRSQASPAG